MAWRSSPATPPRTPSAPTEGVQQPPEVEEPQLDFGPGLWDRFRSVESAPGGSFLRAGRSAEGSYRSAGAATPGAASSAGQRAGQVQQLEELELPRLHHRMLFSIFQAVQAVDAVVYDVSLMVEGQVMKGQVFGALLIIVYDDRFRERVGTPHNVQIEQTDYLGKGKPPEIVDGWKLTSCVTMRRLKTCCKPKGAKEQHYQLQISARGAEMEVVSATLLDTYVSGERQTDVVPPSGIRTALLGMLKGVSLDAD